MITRSIRFREHLLDGLEHSAERMNVSVNWLVNQLCQEGLERLDDELKVTK